MSSTDTIFALATPRGKSGVAVIRVSGPAARQAAEALGARELPERGMVLRTLRGGEGGVIDHALVLRFPAEASFTGEETVEFQTHGSPAVVDSVLRALAGQPNLRAAEPGEFTRRALEHGRLDLAQVEGLADLIEAETEAQRRQAMAAFEGALGAKVESWRARLIRAAALIEATIDFADEDVPVDVTPEVAELLAGVRAELAAEQQGVGIAERIREGFEVAIVGAPNVGKSTLLNALAGREAAITSEVAGTTRDIIEVRMDLGGFPVTLLDTAGIREASDAVERIGVDWALKRANAADIRVLLAEPADPVPEGLVWQAGDLRLAPKRDAGEDGGISGRTGAGIEALVRHLQTEFGQRAAGAGVATRQRHAQAMARAESALEKAGAGLEAGAEAELVAEELRGAIRALDALIGRVDVEHLLDEIFARFCIGK